MAAPPQPTPPSGTAPADRPPWAPEEHDPPPPEAEATRQILPAAVPTLPSRQPSTNEHPDTGEPAPLPERVEALAGQYIDVQLVDDDALDPDRPAPLPLPARYQWLGSLGEGGQGRVELVLDLDLGRPVALKTLHAHRVEPHRLAEFYREVRITGQLEHPHIIPIYDAGQLPDGRIYYTMRRVPGRSLHQVLAALRRGDAEHRRRWPLNRLVQTLIHACHGLGYAHAAGIVHRDVKPANILLGDHGEVLVVDWGIARVLGDSRSRRLWSRPGEQKRERVRGSPPYMSPEQIQHPDQVTPAADVFCAGVLLYEMLTQRSPFTGGSVQAIVTAVCHERPVPPRERTPHLSVPEELEEICLRCLEKFPGHRYADGAEVAQALEDWQTGSKRRDTAARRVREALSMRSRYRVLSGRLREAQLRLAASRGPVGDHPDGFAPQRPLEERTDSLQRAADGVYSEAVWALHRALADDPDSGEARDLLGELYGERYAEAERLGADRELAHFRALLRQFDDGRWGRWLRTGAELVLLPDGGAELELHRLVDAGPLLVLGELVPPDRPGRWALAPGRYALAHPGDPSWHYPVLLRRDARLVLDLDTARDADLGDSFCFVPGGLTVLGGDPEAPGSGARRRARLPSFAIARAPVTVGAYALFLDWVGKEDPELALRHRPPGFEAQRERGDDRPVRDVCFDDAAAYCRWMSDATGVVIRPPTADEWEKAARGADERAWPWGDRFAPDLCASLWTGQPEGPPPPPGTFAADCSPFGLVDCAGGVWEWTASDGAPGRRLVVGGSYLSEAGGCRCAARRSVAARARLPGLGFRVVRDLG